MYDVTQSRTRSTNAQLNKSKIYILYSDLEVGSYNDNNTFNFH